jgi:hypothetical protein
MRNPRIIGPCWQNCLRYGLTGIKAVVLFYTSTLHCLSQGTDPVANNIGATTNLPTNLNADIHTIPNDPGILSISVGNPIVISNKTAGQGCRGDTWILAWTRDNIIYTPNDDGCGFGKAEGNLGFNRIIGERPEQLTGEGIVPPLSDHYGKAGEKGPDNCTWKSSGCIALEGALYCVVARHLYGEQSGDVNKRQTAHNSSIIKSTDGGKTWTPSAQENYEHPMFPGTGFAAPYFVTYGQEGQEAVADKSDQYVYAVSNNGFWDNGDRLVLGRVLRSKLANLAASDWQFLANKDGSNDANWSPNPDAAVSILDKPNHLGMTGVVYLPAQKCYLFIGWYYPAGGGKKKDAHLTTMWDFYVAPHPWGPWNVVGFHEFTPQGYYSPTVCPKFTSPDGTTLWAFTAGDWTNGAVYRLTAVPLTLKLREQ